MRCTGKRSRSRDAFFVRTRAMSRAIPKNDAVNRPSSDAPGSGTAGRTMIERGARRFVGWAKARNAPCPRVSQNVFLKTCFSKPCFSKPRGLRFAQPTLRNARKQKEAERRQTRVSLLHLPAKRAPWPGRARLDRKSVV